MVLPQEVRDRVLGYIQHQGTKSPQALADLVAAGHEKYLAVIAGVDETRATKKPAPDEWCMRELMLHVLTAQSGLQLAVARLSLDDGQSVGGGDARRLIGMAREDDGTPFAALVDELRGLNERTLAAIRAIPEDADLSRKPEHPFFGPLNVREWAAFQRVHDEDHAQHAGKILGAIS
jgi:hypothetical protein